ncbi:MAG: glycosyltransferase family 4 protein [bacterium]|nr:glycosyltransferase family 4 protein [Candidatus Sumerlaeota bacterium]
MNPLKVLWLTPWVPDPPIGAATRVFQLMQGVAAKHEIHLACLEVEFTGHMPNVGKLCRSVNVFPRDYSRRKAQIISLFTGRAHIRVGAQSKALNQWAMAHGAEFDAAISDYTHMGWVTVAPGPKRILDLHNLEYEVMMRTGQTDTHPLRGWYRRLDARHLMREEMELCRNFDLIATCSQREADIISRWGIKGRCLAIPNGVDPTRFERSLTPEEQALVYPEIAIIGTMNYFPNEQGILYFHRYIWPLILARRPQTTYGSIGGTPRTPVLRLASSNIMVRPMVPDTLPYFKKSRLLAASLLSGGGTRVKILEAFAAGTPVVTTSMGCEGIGVRNGVHLRIADDPESFADACLDILEHPEKTTAMTQAARDLVLNHFDSRKWGALFCEALEQLCVNKRV